VEERKLWQNEYMSKNLPEELLNIEKAFNDTSIMTFVQESEISNFDALNSLKPTEDIVDKYSLLDIELVVAS
jgi:hypothetical protein